MGDELRNAQDHELQAEMELRSQLEQAADAAAQPLSPMSPKTATVVLSPDALSPDASPGAFLAPGRSHEQSSSRVKTTAGLTPRPRPQEAIEREEELIETHSRAAERSSWNPEWETTGESWNARHHLAYCNDEMSQNTRCYFDRWLDHRELLPEDDLQVQKPTWRLEPEALSNEERQAERYASTVYSPTGPGLRSSGSLPCLRTEDLAKESITRRRATRVSRDKPWVTRPTRFWELLKQEPCEEEKSKNTISTQTNFPKHEVSNKEKERQWDGHHHAVWSNFQNLQGTILNPAPVRSYFDRPREPDIGSRSAEKKSGNAKEAGGWGKQSCTDWNKISIVDHRCPFKSDLFYEARFKPRGRDADSAALATGAPPGHVRGGFARGQLVALGAATGLPHGIPGAATGRGARSSAPRQSSALVGYGAGGCLDVGPKPKGKNAIWEVA